MKMEEQKQEPDGAEKGEKSEVGQRDHSAVWVGTNTELQTGAATRLIKPEPEEGLQQCWEAQWQEFLRTMQAPCLGWRPPLLPLPPSGESLKESQMASKGAAEPTQWPRREHATQASPGLTSEAHEAYERHLDFSMQVKEEILDDEDAVSLESRRQRFRRFCYWEAEGPGAVCRQLQELCRRWLEPDSRTKEQILELVALEQFLAILPEGVQSCVREGSPETCAQAVALAEEFLLRRQGAVRRRKQVPEAMEGVVVNSHGRELINLSGALKMQPTTEDKQESDGAADSFTADGQDGEDGQKSILWQCLEQAEFNGTSLGKADRTELLLPEEMRGSQQESLKHILRASGTKVREVSSLGENRDIIRDSTFREAIHRQKGKAAGIDCVVNLSQTSVTLRNPMLDAFDKPYKCSDCGRGFHQKPYLRVHERTHTGEKPYKCLDCGKCFNRRTGLCSHQRVHTGEKPYRCSHCGKCFTGTGSLKEHERTHTGEKPHKCLYCGKSFNRRGVLCKHKRLHTGEKPYRCSYCGKNFSQRSHLISHERTHTGEKPYKCADCGKSFCQSNDLSRHQKIHKSKKPYKCVQCGECFCQRAYLVQHERAHTEEKLHECLDCGKSTYQQAHHDAHKKIHTEERPYHCFECGKSFHQSSELCRHQSLHDGEKQHQCPECGESFYHRVYLMRHVRTHM